MSFEVCALDGGRPLLEESFRTADLGDDPSPLVEELHPHAPYDLVLGALAIGGPKMKVHKTCVRRLFESNEAVLDTDAVYEIAKELV